MKQLLFETDWLASKPVFYNLKTQKASYNINDVISIKDLEIDEEGLANYLDFGYSVFDHTPVKNVRFLRYSTRLWKKVDGTLEAEELDDPIDKWWDYKLSESDVIDLIRSRVHEFEKKVSGPIVIPTSGGYDSRLLNWCVSDKSRIRSFTYGTSRIQSQSFEVVNAHRLSQILGTQWEQIELGDYLQYMNDWYDWYGVSTHAHGMYQIEFHRKVAERFDGLDKIPLISGVFGDVWAGSTSFPGVPTIDDLPSFGYTHGLGADSSYSFFRGPHKQRVAFLDENRDKLSDDKFKVAARIRLKMVLISYLMNLPNYLGFRTWSPFLDIDICMAMLNLPPERHFQRLWQKDFFQKVGLDFESDLSGNATYVNDLNSTVFERNSLPKLEADYLSDLISKDYIHWINRSIKHYRGRHSVLQKMATIKGLWRCYQFFDRHYEKRYKQGEKAYNAHMTLWPLQRLLKNSQDRLS